MAYCDSPSSTHKRPKIEAAPSQFMDYATDDLLLEILLRLTNFKSIIRCSSVCKRWFSLIYSPHFRKPIRPPTLLIQNMRSDSAKAPNVYITSRNDRKPLSLMMNNATSYLNFLPEPHVMVRASFNDLLLVGSRSNILQYYICNPLTRQWLSLLKPLRHSIPVRFGLSYDVINDNKFKYKFRVLLVYHLISNHHDNHSPFVAAVFRSETGEWKESPVVSYRWNMPDHVYLCNPHSGVVVVNGIFYWLEDGRSNKFQAVVALDPNSGLLSFIHLPINYRSDSLMSDHTSAFLGVCNGRLRLIKVVLRRKIDGELTSLWKVWERANDDDREEATTWTRMTLLFLSSSSSESWSLVHDKACGAPMKKDNFVYTADEMVFHPNNGDVVFSSCLRFNRVVKHNIVKGTHEDVLEVLDGNVDDDFLVPFDHGDDDQMISMVVHTLSNSLLPPTNFFQLLHPSWPTPLPHT